MVSGASCGGAPLDRSRAQCACAGVDRPGGAESEWVADFTYIPTGEGWLYLAVVLDLFSRRAVGWSMSPVMNAQFVPDALMMAMWRRGKSKQLLHHSDQRSQYTSEEFQRLPNRVLPAASIQHWATSARRSSSGSLQAKENVRRSGESPKRSSCRGNDAWLLEAAGSPAARCRRGAVGLL